MEMTVRMPANYNLLAEEEMTYTTGGANATVLEAVCAWFVPFYGWYKGITAVRDYRRQNPSTWLETGLDAYFNDIESGDVVNMLYDIACGICVASSCMSIIWLIPNALIVFG